MRVESFASLPGLQDAEVEGTNKEEEMYKHRRRNVQTESLYFDPDGA
jgi:hypothetical protein